MFENGVISLCLYTNTYAPMSCRSSNTEVAVKVSRHTYKYRYVFIAAQSMSKSVMCFILHVHPYL